MKTKKSVGMNIKAPEKTCNDKNCPFHGSLKIKGRSFVGHVTSDSMAKTISVSFERRVEIPKYERYAKKFTTLKAHNPDCIKAVKGDLVKIMETRPLSKTKNFVVVEIMTEEEKPDKKPKKVAKKPVQQKSSKEEEQKVEKEEKTE